MRIRFFYLPIPLEALVQCVHKYENHIHLIRQIELAAAKSWPMGKMVWVLTAAFSRWKSFLGSLYEDTRSRLVTPVFMYCHYDSDGQ